MRNLSTAATQSTLNVSELRSVTETSSLNSDYRLRRNLPVKLDPKGDAGHEDILVG